MRSRIRITVLLTIVIAILCVMNAAVCAALAVTFGLQAAAAITLGVSLAALSAGFIGATILGSYFYNIVTRTLYSALATWIGTGAYLFFASVLFLLVNGIAVLVTPSFPTVLVGRVFLAVAFLISIYGVLHARRITVTRYAVALRDLPAAWKNKKAVWISDLHLGQLHGPAFAQRVADAVRTLAPDIIFIGGDLYDGTGAPDPSDLARPIASLTAPRGVFFITGNHEEFGESNRFPEAVRSFGIRVLMDEVVAIEGLQLVGVDYRNSDTADGFKNILSGLKLRREQPSILLKHVPNNLSVAEEAGISLQISGHTHRGQQWPFGYVAELIYKGFGYGLKNHGALQVVVSSGVGTWGPPLRVGTDSEIVEITFLP